jgi:multiple sugar transport system substrate-binding protein
MDLSVHQENASGSMKFALKQRWGILILILIALVYLISYYFVIQKPKTEITEIYFADRISEAHRILIDRYNAMHQGKIKVVPIDFPNMDFSTNDRKEILARSLRGEGDGIDLLAVDVVWVQRFEKWCEPLDSYFTQDEIKKITKESISSCYNDGRLVAIPLDVSEGVMYYREDLVRQLPNGDAVIKKLQENITWEDFIALKEKFSGTNPFYIFPAADNEGLICNYVEILLSLRPDYFKKYGFNFDTREAHRALQLMVDFVEKNNMSPEVVTSLTEAPSYEYFIQNDGIFIRGWNTYVKDFELAPFDSEKQNKLQRAVIPHFAGGVPAMTLGGWDLMISKYSTKKKETADFIKYLLNEESQEIFYSFSGYFPVLNSFYEDSVYRTKYPEMKFVKKMMSYGVQRPPHKDYTKFSKIMSNHFVMAIKGKLTVDEALKQTTQMIRSEQILNETK